MLYRYNLLISELSGVAEALRALEIISNKVDKYLTEMIDFIEDRLDDSLPIDNVTYKSQEESYTIALNAISKFRLQILEFSRLREINPAVCKQLVSLIEELQDTAYELWDYTHPEKD